MLQTTNQLKPGSFKLWRHAQLVEEGHVQRLLVAGAQGVGFDDTLASGHGWGQQFLLQTPETMVY